MCMEMEILLVFIPGILSKKPTKRVIIKQACCYVNDEQQYLILSHVVPTYVSAPNGAFIKAPG